MSPLSGRALDTISPKPETLSEKYARKAKQKEVERIRMARAVKIIELEIWFRATQMLPWRDKPPTLHAQKIWVRPERAPSKGGQLQTSNCAGKVWVFDHPDPLQIRISGSPGWATTPGDPARRSRSGGGRVAAGGKHGRKQRLSQGQTGQGVFENPGGNLHRADFAAATAALFGQAG
jgi:hypothetical protein